jgi:hypothetical protein
MPTNLLLSQAVTTRLELAYIFEIRSWFAVGLFIPELLYKSIMDSVAGTTCDLNLICILLFTLYFEILNLLNRNESPDKSGLYNLH